MRQEFELKEVLPVAATSVPTAAQISTGIPIPPIRLLQVMSPDDWEQFTEEWLSFHKTNGTYKSIRRYSGPGDLGLDVVAFTSEAAFAGIWDSYQCKRYEHPLRLGDIYGEIGKIVYHSFMRTPPFNQAARVPRMHVFVSPLGVGIALGRLLKDPSRLKAEIRMKWESHCVPAIGVGITAPLRDDLLNYFDCFDFSIFGDRTSVELIEEHSQTTFHAPRFGGGLPPRDPATPPPTEPVASESQYLNRLLEAYADSLGQPILAKVDLLPHPDLMRHYERQRVLFFSAESLRNFARDRTPPRTFDSLQDDVYNGVIDVCESTHTNALERLRRTISTAGQLDVGGNALSGVTKVADKQGICHQLANDSRLDWKSVS
jgi:hypothetical protein